MPQLQSMMKYTQQPQTKAKKRYCYRVPGWLRKLDEIAATYWAHWILGFVAGYLLAALVAAPHWRPVP